MEAILDHGCKYGEKKDHGTDTALGGILMSSESHLNHSEDAT